MIKSFFFNIFKKLSNTFSGMGFRKIPGFSLLYKYVYRAVKLEGIREISCNGYRMFINASDEGVAPALLIKGVYEKDETDFFKKTIKPGYVILDIGANIGYWSLLFGKLTGENGKVYAFEPEPNNFNLLKKNIEMNLYKNIEIFNYAVSNKNGEMELFTDNKNLGLHSLSSKNITDKKNHIKTETISLDDFFMNKIGNSKADLIKIDVQGAEGLVLSGAGRLIKENNLKIFMEFWPYGLKNFGTNPDKLLSDLIQEGYRINIFGEPTRLVQNVNEISGLIKDCYSRKNGKGEINLLIEK